MKLNVKFSDTLMAFVLGCGMTIGTVHMVNISLSNANAFSQTVNQKQIVNCSRNEVLDNKMK